MSRSLSPPVEFLSISTTLTLTCPCYDGWPRDGATPVTPALPRREDEDIALTKTDVPTIAALCPSTTQTTGAVRTWRGNIAQHLKTRNPCDVPLYSYTRTSPGPDNDLRDRHNPKHPQEEYIKSEPMASPEATTSMLHCKTACVRSSKGRSIAAHGSEIGSGTKLKRAGSAACLSPACTIYSYKRMKRYTVGRSARQPLRARSIAQQSTS